MYYESKMKYEYHLWFTWQQIASSHRFIMGKNLVTTLASSFLIGSSLSLQVTRTTLKYRMGSKFSKI